MAPSGRSGVQRMPKAGQSDRLPPSTQNFPRDAFALMFANGGCCTEPRECVVAFVLRGESQFTRGNLANSSPVLRVDDEDATHEFLS